jgi:hypothetical protein
MTTPPPTMRSRVTSAHLRFVWTNDALAVTRSCTALAGRAAVALAPVAAALVANGGGLASAAAFGGGMAEVTAT